MSDIFSRKGWQGEASFLALLAISLVTLFYETFQFKIVPWDPLGMAFWPRLQLTMLGVALLTLAFQLPSKVEKSPRAFFRGLAVLSGCVVFVFGILLLGIYICTPIFLITFALFRGSEKLALNIASAIIAAALILLVVFTLFDLVLGLRILSSPIWMR